MFYDLLMLLLHSNETLFPLRNQAFRFTTGSIHRGSGRIFMAINFRSRRAAARQCLRLFIWRTHTHLLSLGDRVDAYHRNPNARTGASRVQSLRFGKEMFRMDDELAGDGMLISMVRASRPFIFS
jgi:hypothetical protein